MEIRVGERIRALREKSGVTQDRLREVLGLENRQTIGQIEADERRITVPELMTVLEFFDVPLERFTNPFIPMATPKFSWRQSDSEIDDLRQFEERASEWIGAYREFGRALGEDRSALRHTLDLTFKSSFEEATAAGSAMARQLELGIAPGKALADVMQQRMGILVLMVDALPGISGAASTLPDLDVALINRREPEGRRNFDLAHELFHLLTWKTMPPKWLGGEAANDADAKKLKRIEQLADRFAAGLLMPKEAIEALGEPGEDVNEWVKEKAGVLGVSAQALGYELIDAGIICPEYLHNSSRRKLARRATALPPLFSRPFAERLAKAISRGLISVSRAAVLTDLTIEAMGRLFDDHGVVRPSTMGGPMADAA